MQNSLYENLMAMGWYMRRTADSHTLGDFYRDVVGLPIMRGGRPWNVTMFWGGETTVFELKSDEAPMPERETDPDSAPCTPIFRVHGLDGLVQKIVSGGGTHIKTQLYEHARIAYLLDTDRQIIALRESARTSPLGMDREAWCRFDAGDDFNPACAPLSAGIQRLDGVVMRVADLPRMRAFYRDIVGLSEVYTDDECVILNLGDNTYLELRGGGHLVPVPADRVEITNSFILRMQDTDAFKDQLKAHGVVFVNEHIQWKRAHLAYFADPEGRIIGIEQRYAPENFREPVEPYPEDLESERRFQARDV